MTTTAITPISTGRSVRVAGAWCLAAGLLGAIQAGAMLAWPEQVPSSRYSYPFTGGGFAVAQVSFFLQHVPLVAGVAALLRLPAVQDSRVVRYAVAVAVVGLALLTVMELITIAARDVATDSSRATLINNLYGPPILLIGTGLLVAGAALLRQGRAAFDGARWLPVAILALGIYVFVPLSPAIAGSFTAGRLGIGGWMLLFAVFGYGLTRLVGARGRTERKGHL